MSTIGTCMVLVVFAYLLGSIPFGKIVGKRRGIDIQKHGSGNIGFANAFRVLGWKPSLIVLAGDILKGFVPVLIATQYLPTSQVLVVGLAAVIGHIFPVWLGFKGGKGIATGLGVTLVLAPLVGLLGALVYIIAFAYFRKSGPSSIVATWSLPIFCALMAPEYTWFYVSLGLLALWTHRANLKDIKKLVYAS